MTLLRNAGPLVELELEYDLNAECFRRCSSSAECRARSRRRNDGGGGDAPLVRQKCAELQLEESIDERDASNAAECGGGDDDGEDGAGGGLFGFTLRGGAYGPDRAKNRPLTVMAIRPGGAAHRCVIVVKRKLSDSGLTKEP